MEVELVSVAFTRNLGEDVLVVVIPADGRTDAQKLISEGVTVIFCDPTQSHFKGEGETVGHRVTVLAKQNLVGLNNMQKKYLISNAYSLLII